MLRIGPRERSLLNWLFAAGVVVVIGGSLLPSSSPVMTAVGRLPVTDKVLHFTAYFTLAAMAALGRPAVRTVLLLATGLALLGALLEVAQNLVPGRSPDIADEGANILGCVFGVFVGRLIAVKAAPAAIES